jgi:hypothetical protein
VIRANHRLSKLKVKEKVKLLSEEEVMHRSQRFQDVEATFGILKNNKYFKRFLCRGKDTPEVEFGLLLSAYNWQKWHRKVLNGLFFFLEAFYSPNSRKNGNLHLKNRKNRFLMKK